LQLTFGDGLALRRGFPIMAAEGFPESRCLSALFAGIYAFFNIIIAGYAFMSAGGNPEKIANAWAKIWQTLLGLVIAAASFVLAAIFGQLIFRDPNALLQLRIFTP